MGQLLSGPEQRRGRLRRLSNSVQRRFKRARPATPEPPVKFEPIHPAAPVLTELEPHLEPDLVSPDVSVYTAEQEPLLSPRSEDSSEYDSDSSRDDAYLLLLGRLLAIAASMTAASLVPSRASRGELHGATPESGDTSFLGFVDSLLSGSHSHELSQAMFSEQGGRNFLRMFRFPQDDAGLTPVLIVGARAAESQDWEGDEEETEQDLGFPHLPLDRTSRRPSRSRQSWVIYVVGTAFPQSHEIFRSSSLQSDNPTIEDILILESLLSNPNAMQTASKDQLAEAGGLLVATEADEEELCSICLDNYVPGDNMRMLECKHKYHQLCVDKWLSGSHNSCPICRKVGVPYL